MSFYIYQKIDSSTVEEYIKYEEGGGEREIRLNSEGGNIFSALAIYNLMKEKGVTVRVDGLCGSAATLIACGGRCIASANALFMIHNPMVELESCYTAAELENLKESLDKVRETMLKIYITKMHISIEEIGLAMAAESWYSAEEAKAIGLVDEIEGGAKMENKALMARYKNSVIAAERARVNALAGAKVGNAAVDAVIDVAIKKGATLEEVAEYIAAVKGTATGRGIEELYKLIEDHMSGGGEGVTGDGTAKGTMAELIAKYANSNITKSNSKI